MTTGIVWDERFCEHDTGRGHPERPDRLRAIHQRLQATGLIDLLTSITFEPAPSHWIEQIHDQAYVERLYLACERGEPFVDVPDSVICRKSADIARLAVGGSLAAADAVMSGQAHNAFCVVRPPGHHAERDRSMGFCLFNNVAIVAQYLRMHHEVERIAVVDFDVHHGNGTQHAFELRRDVLFVSLHEDPRFLYPGTGFSHEQGKDEGQGYTLNLPMAPRSGDGDYEQAFEQTVLPRLDEFDPQVLLVSAGFDAAAADPLGHVELTTACYRWMADQLRHVAERHSDGRMICLLEGGYDLEALADGVEAVLQAIK